MSLSHKKAAVVASLSDSAKRSRSVLLVTGIPNAVELTSSLPFKLNAVWKQWLGPAPC